MADDDKGTGHPPPVESVKSEPPKSEPHTSEVLPTETPKPETSKPETPRPAAAPSRGPMSEWTASDRRGPMEQAPPSEDSTGSDIERFVPAHELDAEGDLDRPSEETGADHAPYTPHEPATSVHDTTVATPPSTPERRRSLLPVAAGLVVGAIIGAGSAWLVYSLGAGAGDEPQKIASLNARVDALERRPAAKDTQGQDTAAKGQDAAASTTKLQADVTELQGKVAALAGSAPKAQSGQAASASQGASDGALGAKVAALAAAVEALRAKGGAASQGGDAKVATLQTGLADARKQAADAQSGLDSVKAGQKQLDDKLAALTAAVTGVQTQAQGAQAGLDGVRKSQATLEGKLGSPALAVVADSLVQQIGAGQPYARQVDALAGLGADPTKVAVLRENAAQGVPSAPTLAARWKPLAEPVIATGNKAPANADFGQRLEHGLFGLVSVRRADGTVGDDLASRVNLIAADLAAADVAGAYKVWEALPPDAKARSAEWGAQAKTSSAALAAARDLQQQAIDALGAKKS